MNIELNEILARLVASENLTIRYSRKATTASFEVDTRVLTLPIYVQLNEVVYQLLAAHEAFHALWTTENRIAAAKRIDPSNLHIAGQYVNVCEDVRIENLGKELYPGIRRIFFEGYKIMVNDQFFGDLSDINHRNFIDRINVYFKAGATVHVEFSQTERPYVDALSKVRGFDNMIAICKSIYELAREQAKQQNDQSEESDQNQQDEIVVTDDSDSDDSSQDGKTSSKNTEQSEQSDDSENSNESQDSDAPGSEESNDSKETQDSSSKPTSSDDSDDTKDSDQLNGEDGAGNDLSGKMEPTTQNELDKSLSSRIDTTKKLDFEYLLLPNVLIENAVVDYKTIMADFKLATSSETHALNRSRVVYQEKSVWFESIRRQVEPEVQYMFQQFSMKKSANILSKTSVASTGDIDMTKLWSHKVSDDIFLTKQLLPKGKNHGMLLVVDWSGSMINPLFDVLIQLLSLMMFCRRAQIPYEVYVFVNRNHKNQPSFLASNTTKSVSVADDTKLYNIFSSRMPTNHFYQMCLMMFSSFHNKVFTPALDYLNPKHYNTPLGESMLIVSEIADNFQKKNRIEKLNIVFLTDGEGNSNMNANADMLEDPKTKRTYRPKAFDHIDVVEIMPKIVRDRTKAKMIGFYIGSPTQKMIRNNDLDQNVVVDQLLSEGYITLPKSDYDVFYLMNPSMSAVSEDADTSMRLKAKVMLRKFIEMVS